MVLQEFCRVVNATKWRIQLVTLFLFLPYHHLRLDSIFYTILFIFDHWKFFWQTKFMIRKPNHYIMTFSMFKWASMLHLTSFPKTRFEETEKYCGVALKVSK